MLFHVLLFPADSSSCINIKCCFKDNQIESQTHFPVYPLNSVVILLVPAFSLVVSKSVRTGIRNQILMEVGLVFRNPNSNTTCKNKQPIGFGIKLGLSASVSLAYKIMAASSL